MMSGHMRQAVIPAYVGLCLALGGSSAAGILPNLLLQLLAIVIICWAIASPSNETGAPAERQLLWISALTLVLILIQVAPLPPDLWTALPGRQQIADGYTLLGLPLPWQPLSLAPYHTIEAALSLLPPLAVMLGMIKLRAFRTAALFGVVVGVAVGSLLLGALQVSGGSSSGFYPYEDSSFGGITGFFANSNHLATLLVVAVPLLAALFAATRDRQPDRRSSAGRLLVTWSLLGAIGVGIAVNGSFAGLALAVPVAIASLAFFSGAVAARPRLLAAAVLLVAVPFAAGMFGSPLRNGIDSTSLSTSTADRLTFTRLTTKAAMDFFPAGSGGGTFEDVYALYENWRGVGVFFVNNAHNDYFQILLEYGAAGGLLILLFLIWWVRNAHWPRAGEPPDHARLAATIASAAILAHSLVDYPLRTAAVSALLAACCSLMAMKDSAPVSAG
jgi:hypothetical protein